MILCTLFAVATASAQDKKISLPRHEVTLPELFGQIGRQAGITVVFDEGIIPYDRTVRLSSREGTVSELLAQALPAANYTWQAMENYILVRAANPKPAVQTPSPSPQPSRAEFEREIKNYTREHIPTTEVASDIIDETLS